MTTAVRRNQRWRSSWRFADSQKAKANKAMKKKPSPTMKRNDQNSGGTLGTVSQAACSICVRRRVGDVVGVALEQQAVAEIA